MNDVLQDPRIAEGMRAQMRLRKRLLAEGAQQVGWKVGFGAPAAMAQLDLTAPLVGFVLDRALLPSGVNVPVARWKKPVAEAEIAAYIGQDLSPGASRDETRKAIVAIGPAIELTEIDCPTDDVKAMLAGDIFQRNVILGPRDIMRGGARLNGLKARVRRSGQDVPVPLDLETNTGDLVNIVRHVAEIAAAVGERLKAGQFIICGSLTAPMPLEIYDHGVDFELAPIGATSVQFPR